MTFKNTFTLIGVAAAMGLSACAQEASEPTVEAPQEEQQAVVETQVRDVKAQEASGLIEQDDALIVLDVRTPEEFAAGHVPGAINVNFKGEDFTEQLAKLDHSATYVLHCKSGGRSVKALDVMKAESFENIIHMSDGFDAWVAAGLATEQ